MKKYPHLSFKDERLAQLANARQDLSVAVSGIIEKYDLSNIELFNMLTEEFKTYIGYALRDELKSKFDPPQKSE